MIRLSALQQTLSSTSPTTQFPPELFRLLQLSDEVAAQPIHNKVWKQQLTLLRTQYKKADKRLKSVVAKEQGSGRYLEFARMRQGYRNMLRGLKRIEVFDQSSDPVDLTNGWRILQAGYRDVAEAGENLQEL